MALASLNPRRLLATVQSSGLWELERTSVQDFGLTINQAALFTNSPEVTLTLSAPAGTSEMQIANDGGFSGADWEPYAATKPWTLITYGNQVLPRTVYARFRNGGQTSGLYLDDIILDLTAPTGSVTISDTLASQAVLASPDLRAARLRTSDPLTHTYYLPFISLVWQPGMRAVTLHLVANDAESGIGGMLISNQPDFANASWQNYVSTLLWQVKDQGTTTVSIRFRDRAGNLSPIYTALTTAP